MTKNKVFNVIGQVHLWERQAPDCSSKKRVLLGKGRKRKEKCGDLQYVYPTKPKLQPQHFFYYKPSFFSIK